MAVANTILLIVSGGIAAVKCPQLIRGLHDKGIASRCILTQGGAQFVTPLSLAALSGDTVYQELFSLDDENRMGHIELSRSADLIVVAPATAHMLARMAAGLADDLASTTLLATDKPVMVAPAMNVQMWQHPATQQNIQTLIDRGVIVIGPDQGEMACGEFGFGRMSEPDAIIQAIEGFFKRARRLEGKRALVTSGPTFEAIDPVRYIANRSSGKQGHAIAAAMAAMGAETTLVSGPTNEPDPSGVSVVHVQSARQMLSACEDALPADIAVCAAAVSDWRAADPSTSKLKKNGSDTQALKLALNPDILATLAQARNKRPALVVGFAAETDNLIDHATQKRLSKGCDWILANDVSASSGTFGGDDNTVHLICADGVEDWPKMSKHAVALKLCERIADFFNPSAGEPTS